jgi:hypothetical protein
MIDAIAGERHFVDHILPIWLALPAEIRGSWYIPGPVARPDIPGVVRGMPPSSRNDTLVASIGDVKRAKGRRIALMEHGCGQSFGGEPRADNYASYAGHAGRDAVSMFLHPGPHPAGRDRARYPNARVEVIGCAKLDGLPRRDRDGPPIVAVSFHWNCVICPETRPAYRERSFQAMVIELAKSFTVIGHGHPREMRRLSQWYRRIGIESVETFTEVCERTDVYVNDASSTLFEFASTGRPVVVLNPTIYRRSVDHGLRFWEASTVGVNVGHHGDLTAAVVEALEDGAEQQAERERCVNLVYAHRSGGAERAAAALMDWATGRKAVAA